MSEIWPICLLLGYLGTLIFSLYTQKTLFREEVKFFSWYFVVSLLAAIFAHDHYLTQRSEFLDGVDVNTMGMIRVLWYDYVIPHSSAFLILNSLRLVTLVVLTMRKNKSRV